MDFYKRVGITVRTVPEGRVATYGQIALLCGKPKNARQVGYALNRGLAGEVPAHRAVNSQGYLTGAASFEMCIRDRGRNQGKGCQCGMAGHGRFSGSGPVGGLSVSQTGKLYGSGMLQR